MWSNARIIHILWRRRNQYVLDTRVELNILFDIVFRVKIQAPMATVKCIQI